MKVIDFDILWRLEKFGFHRPSAIVYNAEDDPDISKYNIQV